ncbi:uncharacterized protein FN964_016078 [Alca torda]
MRNIGLSLKLPVKCGPLSVLRALKVLPRDSVGKQRLSCGCNHRTIPVWELGYNETAGLKLKWGQSRNDRKALGKHITPITLKSTIKSNPLCSDIQVDDNWQEKKKTPTWTMQDYDRHSLHSNFASHIMVTRRCIAFAQSELENPNYLQFWMGDIYTSGYDTLLKTKEREKKPIQNVAKPSCSWCSLFAS